MLGLACASVFAVSAATSLSRDGAVRAAVSDSAVRRVTRVSRGVEFLAEARLSWDSRDRSGLNNTLTWEIKNGSVVEKKLMPHDRLGSLGSGIAYSGRGDLYIACSDRGPGDGAADYACRVHTLRVRLTTSTSGDWLLSASCEATKILQDSSGTAYTGLSRAINRDPARARRLDPEGIRVGYDGTLYISDEYGPFVDHFNIDGTIIERLPIPQALVNPAMSGEAEGELPPRTNRGRQPNRGLEGLAIAPEGMRLYAILQSPLIQDGGLDENNKRVGVNARIFEYNLRDGASGSRRQFVYHTEDPGSSVNEILAVSDRTFLVLERDGKKGVEASFRSIYKITLDGATDVSEIDSLPSDALPSSVRPVGKTLLFSLNDPAFGLVGSRMPEKLEGLTFGPDLADGRRLLLVTVDNDFIDGNDTIIWAFAIDPKQLPDWTPQMFDLNAGAR